MFRSGVVSGELHEHLLDVADSGISLASFLSHIPARVLLPGPVRVLGFFERGVT